MPSNNGTQPNCVVDSIIELCSNNTHLQEEIFLNWLLDHGGLSVLDVYDDFGMSVSDILLQFGHKEYIDAAHSLSQNQLNSNINQFPFEKPMVTNDTKNEGKYAQEESQPQSLDELSELSFGSGSDASNKSSFVESRCIDSMNIYPPSPAITCLLSQIKGIPCSSCSKAETLNWIASQGFEQQALSTVTSITGVVGWMVEEVELRRFTTQWCRGLRGGLPSLAQQNSKSFCASERYQRATQTERLALCREPIFELEAGEGIINIEQLIPIKAKPGDRTLRRGVVMKQTPCTLKKIDIYSVPRSDGSRRGTHLVPGEEFNFVSTQEMSCKANGQKYDVLAYELDSGQGWAVDFDLDDPEAQNIREIAMPSEKNVAFVLQEEVRPSLNSEVTDLGAVITFRTSKDRSFAMVGRVFKEMCASIPMGTIPLDENFDNAMSTHLGVSFGGHSARILRVQVGGIGDRAGFRRGSRVLSVLPGGQGSGCSRVAAPFRSRTDRLPALIPVSSVEDLMIALRHCVKAGVRTCALQLSTYPFASITTRRVALAASHGQCITGMRFHEGVLQHIDTSPLIPVLGHRTCPKCGQLKEKSLGMALLGSCPKEAMRWLTLTEAHGHKEEMLETKTVPITTPP